MGDVPGPEKAFSANRVPIGGNLMASRANFCYKSHMKTAIQAELPQELVVQAQAFVEEGWAGDINELLAEALRRYLESHSSQLTETFIREDVNWGLSGRK
jgi:hypothetical protein